MQVGWIMELKGASFRAVTDHTGLLRVNNEVEPRITASSSVWDRALTENMEGFLQVVRDRSEATTGLLDGLASVILNRALENSLITGKRVNL